MSHLCSAYLGKGKKSKLGDKKEKKKRKAKNDEIYGFLPQTPTARPLSASYSNHLQALSVCSVSHTIEDQGPGMRYGSLDSCGHSDNNSDSSPNHSPNSSGIGTLRSYGSQRYPKSFEEVSNCLENANNFMPANIPMLVTMDYQPSEDWTGKDEVAIHKGMIVNAMYKTFDWVFVKTPDDLSGFVPYCNIDPIGVKKKVAMDFSQQFPENAPPIPSRLCRPQRQPESSLHSSFENLHSYSEDSYRESMRSIAGSVLFYRGSNTSLGGSTLSNRDSGIFNHGSSVISNRTRSVNSNRTSVISPRDSLESNQESGRSHRGSHTSILDSAPSVGSIESLEIPRQELDDFNISNMCRSPMAVSPNQSFVSLSSTSMTIDISDSSSFFTKSDGDRLTVIFDYDAQDENDVTVCHGDVIILLNDEDPDWLWVRCDDGSEGFVPRTYAVNLEALHLDPSVKTTYL